MKQPPSAPTTQAPMGTQEWVMLIALSVLWGGSFFFNGVAVRELPSLTIVLVRVGIAAVTLWAVLTLLNIRMPRMKGLWPAFFGMGLLNNAIPFALFVWGQHHIASGLAAILNATTPLCTVLVAHFLTRDEKLSAGKMAGVVLGLLGLVAQQLLAKVDGTGQIAATGCALGLALQLGQGAGAGLFGALLGLFAAGLHVGGPRRRVPEPQNSRIARPRIAPLCRSWQASLICSSL